MKKNILLTALILPTMMFYSVDSFGFLKGNRSYKNADGSRVDIKVVLMGNSGLTYTRAWRYDANGKQISDDRSPGGYIRYNYAQNGEIKSLWYSGYPTLNYDDDGNLISILDSKGNVSESYKYDANGKMLVYNKDGKLIGAYNDFWDRKASADGFYEGNLSLLDENGDYKEIVDGKVSNIYGKNGDLTKYDYDAGGNLIQVTKNGESIYERTHYTPPEAAAAMPDKNAKYSIKIDF